MTDLRTLDPRDAATRRPAPRDSRRNFFRLLGGGGAAAALLVAGCDAASPGSDTGDDAPRDYPIDGSGSDISSITLDFSNDFGPLNFAYLLEQLESRFYSLACKGPGPYDGISDTERYYLTALDVHESAHDQFLMAAIPDAQRIPDDLRFDFSSVDFSSRASTLGTAQALEDTGVSAYNGAGRFIESDLFLTLAGKIVSVEARHAAIVRLTLLDDPTAFADLETLVSFGAVPANALDAALAPPDVLPLAAPFLTFDVDLVGI